MIREDIGSCEVVIVSSLEIEAQAVLNALAQEAEPIKKGLSVEGLEYRYTTILNNDDETLRVLVSCLPPSGPLEAARHIRSLVRECQPRFAAMTGICAGDRRRVSVGDLVVAERAFSYDNGKYDTTSPSPVLLQYVRAFQGWRDSVNAVPRPISMEQQRDWLLNRLLQVKRVDAINEQELAKNAPSWQKFIKDLQQGNEPMLNERRELIDEERVTRLRFERVFPFQDPGRPACHIASLGSGNAVRTGNPFAEIRVPARGTIAIDIEGAAFYQTLLNFPSTRSLIVKGVADYADKDKDDSFQDYAATASALYMLSFIKEYVNERLMPRPDGDRMGQKTSDQSRVAQTPLSGNLTITPAPSASSTKAKPKETLSLLYFYAKEDSVICEKLKKQLTVMRRLRKIRDYDINDVLAGQVVQKQVQQMLRNADIILLLVSAHLFASENIQVQLDLAWQQYRRGAKLISILIKPVAEWEDSEFSKIESLPRSRRPISAWGDLDMALYDIAKELQSVINQMIVAS